MAKKKSNFITVGKIDKKQKFKPVGEKKVIGKTIKAVGRSIEYGHLFIFFDDNSYAKVKGDYSEDRPYISDFNSEIVTLKELEKEAGEQD